MIKETKVSMSAPEPREFYGFSDSLVISKDKPTVVLFFWKHCGHCHRAIDMWNKVASVGEEDLGIAKFVSIEVENTPEIPEKFGVKGFPTIMRFDMSENRVKVFEKQRTEENLMSFAASPKP